MVGYHQIDRICCLLHEKGIQFKSSMITNGSLFTKELVSTAYEKWNITRVQVTLDGNEEVYNRVKAYTGFKKSPYYIVLENIGYMLDIGITVSVRLNFDYYNVEILTEVIDELANRFHGQKKFMIYLHELFEDEGSNPVYHSLDERNDLEKKKRELEQYIISKGCQTHFNNFPLADDLPKLKINSCMADNAESFLVNPLGQLGKCEHYLFTHLVGEVNSYDSYNKCEMKYWLESGLSKSCESCSLFPFCGIPLVCDNAKSCNKEQLKSKLIFYRQFMIRVLLEYDHIKFTER